MRSRLEPIKNFVRILRNTRAAYNELVQGQREVFKQHC